MAWPQCRGAAHEEAQGIKCLDILHRICTKSCDSPSKLKLIEEVSQRASIEVGGGSRPSAKEPETYGRDDIVRRYPRKQQVRWDLTDHVSAE